MREAEENLTALFEGKTLLCKTGDLEGILYMKETEADELVSSDDGGATWKQSEITVTEFLTHEFTVVEGK